MRFELVATALDTVSFILVTPRLVGLSTLRKLNRITFAVLSRAMFNNDRQIRLGGMITLTITLALMLLVGSAELHWIARFDAGLFGAHFNTPGAWTPLNVTTAALAFFAYVLAPMILIMGWLEVLMTRYDPEGAMLVVGGVLFMAARFLTVLHVVAPGG